jgi:small conductance mechanosensitive channel
VIAAIAIWIVGGMFINTLAKIVRRVLTARQFETTLINYASSAMHVILRILLVMGILEVRHSDHVLAAMIGAVGVALGVAWSGLLSNLRPASSWWCCAPSRWATTSPPPARPAPSPTLVS